MGQTLKKLAPGTEENQIKEIRPIIEKCYETHFAGTFEEPTLTDFTEQYAKLSKKSTSSLVTHILLANGKQTQASIRKPPPRQRKIMTREEFQRIFQDVILGTGFTGVGGAKDTLIYIFGVPLTALFVKQRLMPRVIPNEIFIPCITSATVFVLAKLNKI
ncbi:unnamed protein product [Prunus armeniaca]|uniref:Uncharacterized protein n=1 Tax=Prunus armeniaca TaxID=36596 RepID=A0A6J5XSJ9_PRUAR|nr:unnamed protein product [Prunus armeniaca]